MRQERLRDFLQVQNGTATPVAYAGRTNRTRGYDDDDSDAISLQTLDGEGRRRTGLSVKRESDDE